MSVTDLFAQVDISKNFKATSFSLDTIQFQTTQDAPGSSLYRDKFKEGLNRVRKDSSGEVHRQSHTETRRDQQLDSRVREDVRPGRPDESHRVDLSRREKQALPEFKENGHIPQSVNSQNGQGLKNGHVDQEISSQAVQESPVDQVATGELTEGAIQGEELQETELDLALQNVEISSVEIELLIPPEGLVDVFDAAEGVFNDAKLTQLETAFTEQEVKPPASFLEATGEASLEEIAEVSIKGLEQFEENGVQAVEVIESLVVNPSDGQKKDVEVEEASLLLQENLEENQSVSGQPVVSSGEEKTELVEAENVENIDEEAVIAGVVSEVADGKPVEKQDETAKPGTEIEENHRTVRKEIKSGRRSDLAKVAEGEALNSQGVGEAGLNAVSSSEEALVQKTGQENVVAAVQVNVEVASEKSTDSQGKSNDVISSVGSSKSLSGKSVSAAKTTIGPQVNQSDVIDRVTSTVQKAVVSGKQMKVRLNPPELGALLVEVSTKDGVMTAKIEVQTQSAQQAIMESLSQLKESLSQGGNNIEFIEVQLNETFTEESGRGKESDQDQESQRNFSENSENSEKQENEGESEEATDNQSGQELLLDELDIQV